LIIFTYFSVSKLVSIDITSQKCTGSCRVSYYFFNILLYEYPATSGNADPEIFIQGMQGYQWTDTDLEFIYQTKLKKQVQQAQVNECIFSKKQISAH